MDFEQIIILIWIPIIWLIVEIVIQIWVKLVNKKFQWLIISNDEKPKLSKIGLKKFIHHGYDSELGWIRKPNTTDTEKNKNGEANNKNHTLTSIAVALMFCAFSLDNPKGKLSFSMNNLILINNIIIPPIYPRANPKPDDFPKFLLFEISFNKEL